MSASPSSAAAASFDPYTQLGMQKLSYLYKNNLEKANGASEASTDAEHRAKALNDMQQIVETAIGYVVSLFMSRIAQILMFLYSIVNGPNKKFCRSLIVSRCLSHQSVCFCICACLMELQRQVNTTKKKTRLARFILICVIFASLIR